MILARRNVLDNENFLKQLVTDDLSRMLSIRVEIVPPVMESVRLEINSGIIDALAVACTHPGMTARLSAYWQARDDPRAPRPHLPPPWPSIRGEAETATANIVVSHRVRNKVSGPLHKETTYGDTHEDVTTKTGTYRQFVTRKTVEALSRSELANIRDARVRTIVEQWVAARGGDPIH